MSDITTILGQIESGDPHAAEQLLPLVYEELRKLAAVRLALEKPGQTLQATALVHDVYLRLVNSEQAQRWDSRAHFFAAAAEAIRRILIENARKKRRVRHGGEHKRIDMDEALSIVEDCDVEDSYSESLLALDEALTRFALEEPKKAELVKLRFYAGCTIDEAAEMLGISRTTAKRNWSYARAWLLAELYDSDDPKNS